MPNVSLRGLSDAIEGLFESWRRLYQRKDVKLLCGSSFVEKYGARARARAGGIDLIYLEIIAYTSYLSSYCAGLSAFQIYPFGITLIQNARFYNWQYFEGNFRLNFQGIFGWGSLQE